MFFYVFAVFLLRLVFKFVKTKQKAITVCLNTPSALWKRLNKICGNEKPKIEVEKLLREKRQEIEDKNDIANNFNS